MSDSEYEEEEFLVFADFDTQLLSDELDNLRKSFKIIGIEEEHPIAEVNGKIFEGTHDFAMGTNLFFVEDQNKEADAVSGDTIFDFTPKQKYKYLAKTNKVINFKMMPFEANNQDDNRTTEKDEDPVENTAVKKLIEAAINEDLELKITYDEALNNYIDAQNTED